MGKPLAPVEWLDRSLRKYGVPTRLLETTRSWVLLAGENAYKFRKPRPEACGDGGGLESRREFCEEHVRLNRRLTCADPHDVLAVCGTPDAPHFADFEPLLDWAVSMQRVTSEELASLRLAQGTLEAGHVASLAEFVARFHREAPTARPGARVGDVADVLERLPSGLAQAAPGASEEACKALERWLGTQAAHALPRLRARLAAGQVREGHGDLRLEHVAVRGTEAMVFGGIEHDPALRWADVLADAAGIMVDLMVHGRRDLAFVFLNRYLACTGDYAGLDLLRFYLVKRAAGRALELATGVQRPDAMGMVGHREHLSLALRLVHSADPRLLITHGPPGSGKSFAAALLTARAGAICLGWEAERERLFAGATSGPAAVGTAARSTVPEGASISLLVKDRLRKLAGTSLAAGFPTIVDGNFLYRWQRDGLQGVASSLGVPFTILDCRGSPAGTGDPNPDPGHDDLPEGDPLGEREQRWAIVLEQGQPLSPAALAACWMRAAPLPFVPGSPGPPVLPH
jgi:uncharacterized protein